MTLIISAITYKHVIQASDRRLTYPDGRLADDGANKAVCVYCADARFSIAYTGIAHVGRMRTDEWLVGVLTDAKAYQMDLRSISELLKTRATTALKKALPRLPLTLALAGYRENWPFVMSVSNIEGEGFQPLP